MISPHEHIHQLNVTAGWWTDLQTGESLLLTRNRPEMMMLVVSELSEAAEADGPDEKCPEFSNFVIELADARIRLMDQLGAEQKIHSFIPRIFDQQFWHTELAKCHAKERGALLMVAVNAVSAAMEAYRKTRIGEYISMLWAADYVIGQIAQHFGEDLDAAVEAKLAYNQNRADHKPENRRAAGGKKF